MSQEAGISGSESSDYGGDDYGQNSGEMVDQMDDHTRSFMVQQDEIDQGGVDTDESVFTGGSDEETESEDGTDSNHPSTERLLILREERARMQQKRDETVRKFNILKRVVGDMLAKDKEEEGQIEHDVPAGPLALPAPLSPKSFERLVYLRESGKELIKSIMEERQQRLAEEEANKDENAE